MSDDTKRPESASKRSAERAHDGGSEDLRFLDLELAEALHGKATTLAREAYLQLLTDRIKAQLAERLAEQIDSLAELAAQDLIADIEANLDIERRIKSRAKLRLEHADRLKALFGLDETSESEES